MIVVDMYSLIQKGCPQVIVSTYPIGDAFLCDTVKYLYVGLQQYMNMKESEFY